jgi:hypothetical protein
MDWGKTAEQLAAAGAPIVAKVLGAVLPFPFNLIASTVITDVAGALGAEPTPEAVGAKVAADPEAAKNALQGVEAKYALLFDFAKLQTDLDTKEAESANLFIAGWRPAFGWLCVGTCAYQMLAGATHLPMIPAETFNPVWLAFGGLMGLRSTEKWAGVATESVKALPKMLARKKA